MKDAKPDVSRFVMCRETKPEHRGRQKKRNANGFSSCHPFVLRCTYAVLGLVYSVVVAFTIFMLTHAAAHA